MQISPRTKTVLMWAGQILMGLLFIMAGSGKLQGGPGIAAMFEGWGYPADFGYVVGAVELLCGLGLLVPRTARYAAFVLIGLMTGAFFTHLANAEYVRLITNVAFASILFGVAYARRHTNKEPNLQIQDA